MRCGLASMRTLLAGLVGWLLGTLAGSLAAQKQETGSRGTAYVYEALGERLAILEDRLAEAEQNVERERRLRADQVQQLLARVGEAREVAEQALVDESRVAKGNTLQGLGDRLYKLEADEGGRVAAWQRIVKRQDRIQQRLAQRSSLVWVEPTDALVRAMVEGDETEYAAIARLRAELERQEQSGVPLPPLTGALLALVLAQTIAVYEPELPEDYGDEDADYED